MEAPPFDLRTTGKETAGDTKFGTTGKETAGDGPPDAGNGRRTTEKETAGDGPPDAGR